MSSINHDSHKKSTSVLEKLGQKISNIKEDIADNIERRKHSHSNVHNNQTHVIPRTNMSDEPLMAEQKSSTSSFENQLLRKSGKNRKE